MRASVLKEKTLYRDIVRGAIDITWQRRELWVLGLLASILAMNGGAFEFIVRAIYKISSGDPYAGGAVTARAIIDTMLTSDTVTQISLAFSIILAAAVAALVILSATAASGALLQTVARRVFKKKQTVREAMAAGAAHVGPLLVTQLVGRSIIFTAFVLAALGVYSSNGNVGFIVGVILFVIFSLAALFVSFLMMMTNAGIMIENERWINAAHDALRFFKRHWLISIEMIGVVFLTALVAGGAIIAALAIVIAPFTLIILALSAIGLPSVVSVATFVFGVIGLAVVVAGGSMLAVFEHAAWALLYARLADRSAVSKLERLWRAAKKKISHA